MLMRLREEHGFSLITAVLISLVVFVLSLVTIAMSAHNMSQSARARERVNAISAAEAGLNYHFSKLQAGSFECAKTEHLRSFPSSTFTTSLNLYGLNGTEIDCATATAGTPMRVRIRSVGRVRGPDPVRTMEALVELTPAGGGALGEGALFADGDILIDSNANIGDPDGDFNADAYANGNITLDNSATIAGSAVSQKQVVLKNNAQVRLDVFAKGISSTSDSVWMDSNSNVLRDVTATTGRIRFNSSARVFRDARAGGAIVPWPATPHVNGTAQQNQGALPAPPLRAFPAFTFQATQWQDEGYTVQTFSQAGDAACAAAKLSIGSNNTVKRVIRIMPSTCQLKWDLSSNNPITLSADLAIIMDGSLMLDAETRFISSANRTFHLIVGLASTTDTCFEMKSNSKVTAPIETLVYAPKSSVNPHVRCRVFLDSNTGIAEGQIFGNDIELKSNTAMTYKAINTPGSPDGGYNESLIYIREVRPE